VEKLRKCTFIEASPAKVFGYLMDPAHLLEIWPSMVEVSNIKSNPEGAHSFDWTYKIAGLRFHGHAETVEIQLDRLRLVRNASGIQSTFRWSFEPRDNGTDFALEVEYEMPGKLLGRLAGPFLHKLNEREADTLVHNLKKRMEAANAR